MIKLWWELHSSKEKAEYFSSVTIAFTILIFFFHKAQTCSVIYTNKTKLVLCYTGTHSSLLMNAILRSSFVIWESWYKASAIECWSACTCPDILWATGVVFDETPLYSSLYNNTFLLNLQWMIRHFLSLSWNFPSCAGNHQKPLDRTFSLLYWQELSCVELLLPMIHYKIVNVRKLEISLHCQHLHLRKVIALKQHIVVIAIVKIVNNNHHIWHIMIIADA